MVKYLLHLLFCSTLVIVIRASSDAVGINAASESVGSFKIEGKVIVPPGDDALQNTRILIDEGLYVGIPQVDGTFSICGEFLSVHLHAVTLFLQAFQAVLTLSLSFPRFTSSNLFEWISTQKGRFVPEK